MKYYMNRFYTQQDGTEKTAVYVHTDKTAAMKQYYKMLSGDIDDETKTFVLCTVMDEDGHIVARQRFDHVTETEEETEETSEETAE